MPRVPIDVTNSVGLTETTGARLQGADSQAGEIIGKSVEGLGQQLKVAAEQQHEYQQKALQLEANKFELSHIQATSDISSIVSEAQGANAGPVSLQATTDLNARTQAILKSASPRVRAVLAPRLAERDALTIAKFREHAFTQTGSALVDTSKAIVKQAQDAAVSEPDEAKVGAALTPAFTQNAQLQAHLGWSDDTLKAENRKVVSDVIESRAHMMGQSDPAAAIAYAAKHRNELGEAGFTRITDSYTHAARGELAKSDPALDAILAGTIAAPVSTDPLAPLPEGASGGGSGPRSVRNNNPGNLRVSSFTRAQPGFKGADGAGYAIFDSPQSGNGAQAALLGGKGYFGGGRTTVSSIIEKWAPRESKGGDNTDAQVNNYIAHVSKRLGVAPGAQLSRDQLPAMAQAMAEFESGGKGGKTRAGSQPQAPSMAGQPAVTASISDIDARIDALPNRSYEAKEALKTEARSRIAEAHQARGQLEEDAGRQAIGVVTQLDKGFTSMSQIPGHVLAGLAPATFFSLQERADRNRQKVEDTPATPEMEALVSYTRLANPTKFASHQFLEQLTQMGAPTNLLRRVGSEQGAVAGALVNQKPEQLSSSQIWTIAKPAFESAGINLDTIEAKKPADKLVERKADAIRKSQALGFLRDTATTWAHENPGKKPDETLIKQWVGIALRRNNTNPGSRALFEQDPHSTVQGMPPMQRSAAINALRRAGQPPTEGNIYAWWKVMVATHPAPQP